jgi:predicted phosphodiesterase
LVQGFNASGSNHIASFKRLLVLGDIHFPWANRRALKHVVDEVVAECDAVVQVGDLYDQYVFSKYNRNPNLITPDAEVEAAKEQATEMWSAIRHASPKAALFQLRGNHDARIDKRIAEKVPEARGLLEQSVQNLYTFDDVSTVFDPTEELFLRVNGEEVCFQHGHRSKLGDHASYNGTNTVCGHSHLGGVVYRRDRRGCFWELNAGWLGNETARVFAYGDQKTTKKWTLGYGLIDAQGPRFCPLKTK